MRLFDTHCHLSWREDKDPVADQLARARENGVDRFLCVATDLASAHRCREIAQEHEGVQASAGVHPNDVGEDRSALQRILSQLEELLAEPGWSAIGETGLDHYREWSSYDLQRESLDFHFELSRRMGLPVILHCREAAQPLLEALRAFGGPFHGVMHCYSEGPEPLEELLALGLHVSFAGNMTYPKNEAIRESARLVPDERLLVETDAPFLAPQPKRGKQNEPAFVRHTLERLAEVRAADPQELAELTYRNGARLFPPAA